MTFFEPIYARRAFPCWDEPHLKTTFDITIRHSKNFTALSNMHNVSIELDTADPNNRITTFATTPKMPAYLVAILVSDFKCLSNNDETFNVCTRPNVIDQGKFGLKIGEQNLKVLDEYTGITFASTGFKAMQSIAVPYLRSAAMENWGLIAYQ